MKPEMKVKTQTQTQAQKQKEIRMRACKKLSAQTTNSRTQKVTKTQHTLLDLVCTLLTAPDSPGPAPKFENNGRIQDSDWSKNSIPRGTMKKISPFFKN